MILKAVSHLYYHLEYLEVVTIHDPLHLECLKLV